MASEVKAQEFVHTLEHGKGRWWVYFLLIVALATLLFIMFVVTHVFRAALRSDDTPLFRGLNHGKGMEQACISRELARGNGFSTKVVKPAAIKLLNERKGDGYFNRIVDGKVGGEDEAKLASLSPEQKAAAMVGNIPDIYHAPLNPWLNSIALRFMESVNSQFGWRLDSDGKPNFWGMRKGERVSIADRTIAAFAVILFYGAIVINYFTFTWLFDRRLSVIMVLIQLLCQHFWEFATTGLPQILLLFLFSGAMLCITRAYMTQDKKMQSWLWFTGAAVLLGLMVLAQPVTLFIIVGAAVFVGLYFRPAWLRVLVLLLVVAAVEVPWAVRNANVSGDFKGLSWQTRNYPNLGTESQIMRTLSDPDRNVDPVSLVNKVLTQTLGQMDKLYYHLGKTPLVFFFFAGLLVAFRKPETRSLHWGLLIMWLFAVFGMSYIGFADYDLGDQMQSNDLHIVFIPFLAAYGLAVLLNLWGRVEVGGSLLSNFQFANAGLITLVVLLSAFPLLSQYTQPPKSAYNFPPYLPPIIEGTKELFSEKEVICSDMPWGVAWYGDRRSVWLPYTLRDFNTLNNFTFNGRIVGLLFTPVTGFRGLLSDVATGEFREWNNFILRTPKAGAGIGMNETLTLGTYFLYADRNRWTERD